MPNIVQICQSVAKIFFLFLPRGSYAKRGICRRRVSVDEFFLDSVYSTFGRRVRIYIYIYICIGVALSGVAFLPGAISGFRFSLMSLPIRVPLTSHFHTM